MEKLIAAGAIGRKVTELKPCSSCGHGAINLFYEGDCGMWHARCTHCGAELRRKEKAEVKNDWNRRAAND